MPQGRPEDYVRYEERDGVMYGITKDGGFHQVPKDSVPSGAKSTKQLEGEFGYKSGAKPSPSPSAKASPAEAAEDEKYGKMTDAEISALPGLAQVTAKRRRARYLAEHPAAGQAKALGK